MVRISKATRIDLIDKFQVQRNAQSNLKLSIPPNKHEGR